MLSWAFVAGPPSPEYPPWSDPATVVMIPFGIDRDVERPHKPRLGGWAAVAREFDLAVTGDRADKPSRVDHPDTVVVVIGEEKDASPAECESGRGVVAALELVIDEPELRLGRWSSVRCEPDGARPGNGRDRAALVHLTDAEVVGVEEVQGSISVDGETDGIVQRGFGRGPAVSRESRGAIAGDRRDGSVLVDHPNPVVTSVRDIERPVGTGRDCVCEVQLRLGGRAAVAREAALR